MIRRYARISGWVQGVGFRYYVRHTASRFALTGWVRNREDGDVELEVQGDTFSVEEFLRLVQEGNRYSQVEGMEVFPLNPIGEYGFEILD